MSALLAQAQQMQQQLMEAQEALANSEVHGQAGGGLVQVTMKGSGEVVAVAIDPKVVEPSDVETLQDLIVGAIADASKQVTILAHDRLGPLADDMKLEGVEHLGRVGHSEMPARMAAADVFVFPSLFEGSAVVTYEALASGLPSIATAASGTVSCS